MKKLFMVLILLCAVQISTADTNTAATNNADTFVNKDSPHSNVGSSTYLDSGDWDDQRICINSTLPAGTGTISEINISLYRYYVANPTYDNTIHFHNLTGVFIENEVDWTNKTNGVAWSTPRGDFDATIIDSLNMTTTGTGAKWINWTLRGTAAENSMSSLTWGDTVSLITTGTQDWRIDRFRSKENATNRPFITITYGLPSITSYAPTGSIYPEAADSQLFNITVDQTTQCRWYVNGSLAQTNATPSLTHAYTNTSLNGGGCNVAAVVNNTNGSDSQTWIFEVGADSISYIILQDTPTNQSMIKEINVTRIGSNVTDWGVWQNHTFDGWQYFFRFTNGTAIKSLVASGNNDALWFNGTSLLPTGVYYIDATDTHTYITLAANQHGLLQKTPTAAETFSTIAAGIDHDRCYTWWDSTTDRWESYRVGYSYNAGKSVPEHDSYFVLMDGTGTTISCTSASAETVAIPSGYYATYLRESTAKTLSAIKTDMGGNVNDLWAFDPTTGAWTDTGTYSVLPNQGLMVNSSTGFNWDGAVP